MQDAGAAVPDDASTSPAEDHIGLTQDPDPVARPASVDDRLVQIDVDGGGEDVQTSDRSHDSVAAGRADRVDPRPFDEPLGRPLGQGRPAGQDGDRRRSEKPHTN